LIRYNYNRGIDPPAPFVYVSLGRPGGDAAAVQWPAQLDTGADRTIIPLEAVRRIGLKQMGEAELGGLGALVLRRPASVVSPSVHDGNPFLLQVYASDMENHVLLGRDVLNRFRIIFDGPQLFCEFGQGGGT
jgi:hypothetical protein